MLTQEDKGYILEVIATEEDCHDIEEPVILISGGENYHDRLMPWLVDESSTYELMDDGEWFLDWDMDDVNDRTWFPRAIGKNIKEATKIDKTNDPEFIEQCKRVIQLARL